ncbi:MAG: translocation/assembly module TamB [Cruoricaptor ignavus]|nr:translocation/assembly module TamB [Cruoricaptor ignavus]
MANLENNNENKNNKSVQEQISDSVHRKVEDVQDKIKEAAEFAKDAVNNPLGTAEEIVEQAAKDVTSTKWWAKLLLYVFWIVVSIFALVFVVLNLNPTKQWAANQALQLLNQDFKAKMSTESIEVNYFGDITIRGLRIKDDHDFDFIKIRELRANSDWFRLVANAVSGSNALSFNYAKLTNADIKVITYKGDSISNFIRYIDNFDSGKPADPKKKPFQLNIRAELVDSKISIINQNSEGDAGRWLLADKVNLNAPTITVKGSDVFARINNFSFVTKRWGKSHFVETFSGDLAITKEFLSLKDLTFNTSHSLLQGDLKFNLDKKTGWQDFNNKVFWDMFLKRGSQVSGYDISYFVTDWDNPKPINVSGNMNGTLQNFNLKDFVIGNREVSIATKTISLKNLLSGKFVIETPSISTDFTYIDLKEMLPSFISEKMQNFADDFGRLRFSGNARVMPEQIYVEKGNLITGIGQADISQLYLTDYSTNLPKYKGYLQVKHLNARVITKMPEVGLISGNFDLDGQSFNVEEMKIATRSDISSIEILDKTIHNIHLDGVLDKRTYQGLVNVNDQNAKADIKGFIDFKTSRISADISADIKALNLNYFTGQKGNQSVQGLVEGKIEMSNLNDLNLDASTSGLAFMNGKNVYNIPQAEAKVYVANGNRVIEINAPNAVIGRIAGKYNLSDLVAMIENGLGKILVDSKPRKLYKNQSFNVEFEVNQGLINYFEPNLKIPSGVGVTGSYDGDHNNLVLNIDAKELLYIMTKTEKITDSDRAVAAENPNYSLSENTVVTKDSIAVNNIVVKINTANQDEQIFTKIDRVKYGETIFKEVSVTGQNVNDETLNVNINLLGGNEDEEKNNQLQSYAISLNQTTNKDGDYVVKFLPTKVNFNDVVWHIDTDDEPEHSITYRKKNGEILIQNFRMHSDNSLLLLRDAYFKSGQDFQATGEIRNFQIGKLLEMQSNGNGMGIYGIANGEFSFTKNQNNLEPLVDLDIENIAINGKDMGKIIINAKNSSEPNIFDVEAKVVSSGIIGNNNLHVTGIINNNPQTPTLDIKADMKDFDLAFSQEFVKDVFGNMRGKANGILNISGPINDIDYSGDISLQGFGMKLLFTGVDYSFEDTVIPLSKGRAILNEIKLKDGRENSSGTISGVIDFETLASMAVQLIMRADNLMVLNTQQKDFDLFWGRVYGQGSLYVSGPVSGLTIATDLNDPFKALNNSMFTFNAGSTSGVDEFKMLRFLKEDETGTVVIEDKKRSGPNMNLDFNIAVDRGTTVNVVLPEDVGNISVRGTANPLRFQLFPNGNIAMNGSYFVDSGTFVSKAIMERTFQIVSGSSMRWDGNAMTPALDIKANYMRAVTNAGQYLGTTLPAVNILLSVDITQTLDNPNIALGISAPDLSSQLKEALDNKMMNEDEKVIQFGSILVMNSFNVQNSGGFDVNLANTLESSGYNLLFRQLGSVLNTISNEFQVDLNYLKGDDASNTGDRANASVSFALSPRVSIKTGLGVPLSKGTENTDFNYLSGEGIIEYDWSKNNDKSRLLRVYSKPSNIGLVAGSAGNAGANQSYGGGVVYSKSFNTIFKRKKKKKNIDSIKTKEDTIKNEILK